MFKEDLICPKCKTRTSLAESGIVPGNANPEKEFQLLKCPSCGCSTPICDWFQFKDDPMQEVWINELHRNFLREQFYE